MSQYRTSNAITHNHGYKNTRQLSYGGWCDSLSPREAKRLFTVDGIADWFIHGELEHVVQYSSPPHGREVLV